MFWMGHRCLGDVLGFCAAAHLYSVKTGAKVKVWFDPGRKQACEFFDGVEWVEKTPDMIDCGGNPSLEEWPTMNGVKRFYRYMDPTMSPGKSFDIHFNRERRRSQNKLIGLITHSNTQGDVDPATLGRQMALARQLYPSHRIALIGGKDNTLVPEGVEDLRQEKADIRWIIEMVEGLDLLITPQSGPCFCAAGWKIPMWVYRSKESFWDWTLNYDTYKVERWFDRPKMDESRPLFGYQHLKFLSPGLGDAIGCLNVAEKIGREQGIKLAVSGGNKDITAKLAKAFSILDLHWCEVREARPGEMTRDFQSWGSDTNWAEQWPTGAGCRDQDSGFIRNRFKLWDGGTPGKIGISFTAGSCRGKIPILQNREIILNHFLNKGCKITYFGRSSDDTWLNPWNGKISFFSQDVGKDMIMEMASCERFIGIDSGMAWIAVITRVPTTIVVGRGFLEDPWGHSFLPRTFEKLGCVKSIKWVDDFIKGGL